MKVQKKVFDWFIFPLFTIFIVTVIVICGYGIIAFTGVEWAAYTLLPFDFAFTVYATTMLDKYIKIY